jgi:hypothetical protein
MEKNSSVHTLETIDRRVLGAIRLMDSPSQTVIRRPMILSANGVHFFRNRSGSYVIESAPGLEHHITQFEKPPEDPPLGDVELDITLFDPSGYYLPRKAIINLPRDASPVNENENEENTNSLFRAIDITMFSAPHYRMVANWSGVRASLWSDSINGAKQPIAGALLRVVRKDDDELLASGLSDERGEALVTIPGIPITNFTTTDVNSTTIEALLEVIVHPDLLWPADPDQLEANSDLWWRNEESEILLHLSTGHIEIVAVEVDMSEQP